MGDGAERFAVEQGVRVCDPDELVSDRERARWEAMRGADTTAWAVELFGDTVGAVALDEDGNLAAATSTGGSPMKPLGRVGDSPFVGAGLYAHNATAAVSTTGHGELIIPLVWSKQPQTWPDRECQRKRLPTLRLASSNGSAVAAA